MGVVVSDLRSFLALNSILSTLNLLKATSLPSVKIVRDGLGVGTVGHCSVTDLHSTRGSLTEVKFGPRDLVRSAIYFDATSAHLDT